MYLLLYRGVLASSAIGGVGISRSTQWLRSVVPFKVSGTCASGKSTVVRSWLWRDILVLDPLKAVSK